MLGLANQVAGYDMRIRGLVGDDCDFGRTREQIDADASIEHTLGFSHEPIARPDQNIGFVPGKQTEGHRRDALHATHCKNGIRSAEVSGVNDRRVNT